MASQYFLTIKLDPHYQRFLRTFFSCETEIFEFPSRSYFNTVLEHFVVTKWIGYTEPVADERTFKIMLPNFAKKNPAFFKYLSEVKEGVLKAQIKEFYDWKIQERIRELLSIKDTKEGGYVKKLDRQQCTLLLIDEYGFNNSQCDSFDRLYKLFSRFKTQDKNRKYYNKKKVKKAEC